MTGRIVLFGATGYTGRLTAARLASRGTPFTLAGRSAARLEEVRDGLGLASDTPVVVADAADDVALSTLVARGDVLVTTVGPFQRVGRPAARAAAAAGAAYVDSTGEPAFLRWMTDELDDPARATGAVLLPAFGYDYVPGHLAAALALDDAGDRAAAVRVGYFVRGAAEASGGTKASMVGVGLEPGYAYRDGRLVSDWAGTRRRAFRAGGRDRPAVSMAGSEPLFLPRSFPRLRAVEVYLGWAGGYSRAAQAGALGLSVVGRLPLVTTVLRAAADRVLPATGSGPTEASRARTRTLAVAEALDAAGQVCARVEVEGPSPYDLTADLLASAATRLAEGEVDVLGVVGPVEAFGLERLAALCAAAELVRSGA